MKIKRIIKSKVLGDISRLLIPCLGFHAPKYVDIIWLSNLSAISVNKGNNKITELRTILQREGQNS